MFLLNKVRLATFFWSFAHVVATKIKPGLISDTKIELLVETNKTHLIAVH